MAQNFQMIKAEMTHHSKVGNAKEAGLTLIEVSVILSVLGILAAFMIPSITQFMNDANTLQAQNDTQAIATGIMNFMKDTGQSPITVARMSRLAEAAGTDAVVEVLGGPGQLPEVNHGQVNSSPRGRWSLGTLRQFAAAASQTDGWVHGKMGALEEFLQVNSLRLPLKNGGATFGWNGPYITTELGSDPWGNQYLVNVAYLGTEAGAGSAEGGERQAVFVISAGPNQILETPFSQPISNAYVYGDDIAVRIR